MKINVTKEDILAGQPGSSLFCPIALAMTKLIKDPGTVVVAVEVSYAELFLYDDYYDIILPKEARQFIVKFDKAKNIKNKEKREEYINLLKEFSFEIRNPGNQFKENTKTETL